MWGYHRNSLSLSFELIQEFKWYVDWSFYNINNYVVWDGVWDKKVHIIDGPCFVGFQIFRVFYYLKESRCVLVFAKLPMVFLVVYCLTAAILMTTSERRGIYLWQLKSRIVHGCLAWPVLGLLPGSSGNIGITSLTRTSVLVVCITLNVPEHARKSLNLSMTVCWRTHSSRLSSRRVPRVRTSSLVWQKYVLHIYRS